MKTKIKSICFNLPKIIILIVSLVNFFVFLFKARAMAGYGVLVSPWYSPWSYSNEPSIILLAALILLVDKWWSYLASVILSGYLIAYFVGTLIYYNLTIGEELRHLSNVGIDFFVIGEFQYLFAVIVFSLALIYLLSLFFNKNKLLK